MKHSIRLCLQILALTALSGAASPGQSVTPEGRALFSVKTAGTGPAMILIPGLTSSGDVWRSAVEHYRSRYTCHVLTLAGFADGPPAVEGVQFLLAVRDGILQYIRENRLTDPVLVGHSLGGFLALWVAAAAPGVPGAVVSVDGVPYVAALMDPNATPDGMRAQAGAMQQMYATLSPEQLEAQTRLALVRMISDTTHIAVAAKWARRSDAASVGRAVAEMLTTDLRGEVRTIEAPVLLVGAAGQFPDDAMREGAAKVYEAQVAGVPKHRVVMAAAARHFVMLDDPMFLFATMDEFLGTVMARRHGKRAHD